MHIFLFPYAGSGLSSNCLSELKVQIYLPGQKEGLVVTSLQQ